MDERTKVLLDGFGIRLLAIRGEVDLSCPYDQKEGKEGYRSIIIETNKGDFTIYGCSQCHVMSFHPSKESMKNGRRD